MKIGNVEFSDEQFQAVLRNFDALRNHGVPEGALTDSATVRSVVASKPVTASAVPTGEGTIIDSVYEFVSRFIFLPDESLYGLVAAWIVATHLHERFDYMGYLFAYSPEPESGKTKLLEILHLLVYRSTGLQVSPTEAVMFRTAKGHTQLLDEVDSWQDRDDLKNVLNMGFKKGGVVTRFDKTSKSGFEPKEFPVYAPRALAGIGLSILAPATLGRTFAIAMVRQRKSEKRERFRGPKHGGEAAQLRKQIEDWVKTNQEAVAAVYAGGEFKYLESLSDRTIDIAEPLAAIVEVAYKGHPDLEQARESLVDAIVLTRREQQAPSLQHRVLKLLLQLASEEDPLVGNATELAAKCGNSDDRIHGHAISDTLRTYGFKPKSIRNPGQKPLYRYVLTRTALQDLVDRWVADCEGDPAEEAEQGPEQTATEPAETVTEDGL